MQEIDTGLVFNIQRKLRDSLLSNRNSLESTALRDLSAHMLVYVDDVPRCWQLATDTARADLDIDRVDGGLGKPDDREYFPAFVQSIRDDNESLMLKPKPMDNKNPAFQALWSSHLPSIFDNVQQDKRISPVLRRQMQHTSSFGKMSAALHYDDTPFAIICADYTKATGKWTGDHVAYFSELTQKVLGPILFASHLITTNSANPHQEIVLSDAEHEVLLLAADGKSYKEIAHILSKSISTIDHQLRSARRKYNVHSTPRLIARFLGSGERTFFN